MTGHASEPTTRPRRPSTARRSAGTSRLAATIGALVAVMIVGFLLGKQTSGGSSPTSLPSHSHPAVLAQPGSEVGGLAVSAAGYTLVPVATPPGGRLAFRVTDPHGTPVTTFVDAHGSRMHLVVVRRDLSGYQHLHPTMAADGTWSISLTLPEPGVWKAIADFVVLDSVGAQLALQLGLDLPVAGDYQPHALAAPETTATTGDLTVTDVGAPVVNVTGPLLFTVARSGQPVPLERYLASYGHLVILREADVAYLHVHPDDQLVGVAVQFWLSTSTPGRYRMFFDFEVAGTVHTAQFTVDLK